MSVFLLLLSSELRAALNSATLHYCTTGFGRNTSTKAVSTSAVTRVWLVGSFWHICIIVSNSPVFDK
jgi:hypothetical protein